VRCLAAVIALILAASGCHWSQGWHWPNTATNGSSATETLVLYQNDVVWYQGPYVQHAADQLSRSSAVRIVLVDVCPAGRNCVVWRTGNNTGGLTSLSVNSNRHLVAATVTLDDGVGRDGSVANSLQVACHESVHSLGGGLDNPATAVNEHFACDGSGYPTAHDLEEIGRVYGHRH
jgi:hypothetical protein